MCNPDEICNNGMCEKVRIPACGDGYLDIGEDCDDHNVLDGDGCSSSCKIEYSQENDFCNEIFPCAPGLACSSDGKCERQKKAIDEACASNEECISGNCSEGKCSSN